MPRPGAAHPPRLAAWAVQGPPSGAACAGSRPVTSSWQFFRAVIAQLDALEDEVVTLTEPEVVVVAPTKPAIVVVD